MTDLLDPDVLAQAAELVAEPGVWVQGTYDDDDGHVCAHGAVLRQHCTPGDQYLWQAVMRHKGLSEEWNDKPGRTAVEVADRLNAIPAETTVVDMVGAFGPNWMSVRGLVRRVAVLTAAEVDQLGAAWDAAGDAAGDAARVAAWDAAWVAAWVAAGDAARDAAWDAAWVAAWVAAGVAAWVAAGDAAEDAARDAAWDAAWVAAGVAAGALAVSDLISQHGFTQAHYDLLTGPLASVIGPIHPDDTTANKEQA